MDLCLHRRVLTRAFLHTSVVACAIIAISTIAFCTDPQASAASHQKAAEQWQRHGRMVPGANAAQLRYRAYLQKMHLRSAVRPPAGASGWVPLGPAPLASDATGLGEQNYNWVSGRATAVAIDTSDQTGNTIFIGGAYGGVWKSTNAAAANPANVSWGSSTDDQATLAIGALAVQPWSNALQACGDNTQQSLVLAGTGETDSSADSYYGLGILRSIDAGAIWALIGSDSTGTRSFAGLGFSKIAFSSNNPSLAVAAAGASSKGVVEGLENPVMVNRGLYYSPDCGQNWNYANVNDSGNAISPGSATSVVYNATAGAFFAWIRDHGFYSSTDGANWTRVPNQPGAGLTSVACPPLEAIPSLCPVYRGEISVVHGRNEMYVWYVDSNEIDQGIWQTKDGGVTWTQLDETGIFYCGDLLGGCGTEDGTYNLELLAVPDGQATDLYAGAVNLYKCTISSVFPTCNPNVTPAPPPSATFLNLTHVYGCPPDLGSTAHVHPSQHALASMLLNGNTQDILFFANDGGIYRALDGYTGLLTGSCGGTNQFDSLNQTLGSLTQLVSFSQSPTDPNTMLGGAQGNGSPATAAAEGSSQWQNVNSADGGYSIINPANESEWFTENTGVSIQKCESGISCTSRDFSNGLIVSNATLGGDVGPLYTPYILDPQNLNELVVGTCRVWRGASDGSGFVALSGNFDLGGGSVCSGAETNQVRAMATGGPKDGDGLSYVIYAVTDGQGPNSGVSPSGGHILVTTNAPQGENSWMNQTGPTNPNLYPVSAVVMDPNDLTGDTAYVAIMGFGVSHVWQTTNAGTTWIDFTANLPDAPANALVLDPGVAPTPGTLYVGTDIGVFSTSTATPDWTEIGPIGQTGFLPNVAVTDLAIFNNQGEKKLRASTYGRGLWEFGLQSTPDFQITVANNPQSIFSGTQGAFSITVTALNGYSGTIALACTNGLTAPPSQCSPSGNVTVSIGSPVANASITVSGASGAYNFSVQGTDGNNLSRHISLNLGIEGFSIGVPSPNAVKLGGGATSGPITFQVSSLGPFQGLVNLACQVPASSGIACNLASNQVMLTPGQSLQSTLTVSTSASTPASSPNTPYIITMSGATNPAIPGEPVVAETIALTVLPDFSVMLNNTSASAPENSTATFTGTLNTQDGYSSSVNISCGAGTPPTCSANPASVTPSLAGSPFVVTVESNAVGNYSFNVIAQGTDGSGLQHVVPVTFTSTNPLAGPNFSIQITNSLLSGTPNAPATFNGILTALDGYASAVNIHCGANSPPTCSPVPASVVPTPAGVAFTVTVSSPLTANYNFNVIGQGTDLGQITNQFAVTFVVSNLTFVNNSGPQSVLAGGSATYNLALSPASGTFSNPVTLSCGNLPPTVTCAFSPTSVAAGSGTTKVILTVATSSDTPGLSATINATATAGSSSVNAIPAIMLSVVGNSQGAAPFTINSNSSIQTVAAGQMAAYTFSLSTNANFTGSVSFSCSGLPAESACSFSPAALVPGTSAEPTQTTMQITTTAQVLAWQNPRGGWLRYGAPAFGIFSAVLAVGTRKKRSKLFPRMIALLSALSLLTLLPACGGGTGVAGGQPGTPSGTYTITVTGMSGVITEKAMPGVTLSVQ